MRKISAPFGQIGSFFIVTGFSGLALSLSLFSSITVAEAATFTLVSPQVVTVEGEILLGDCERWESTLRPTVTNVVLNSIGGRVGQGQCISRSIARHQLTTYVRQECASICFLLFAAGKRKWACQDARIGVHHPRDVKSHKEADASSILEYATLYRVPSAIRQKLSVTPPTDMYWLNASDLSSMNVSRCPSVVAQRTPTKVPSRVRPASSGNTPAALTNAPQIRAMDNCLKLTGSVGVAACTAVIDEPKETAATRALAHLLRARAALNSSELDRAEPDINAALVLRSGDPLGYRYRGRLRSLQGKFEEARADYTTAIQLSESQDSRYSAYTTRGHFHLYTQDIVAAQADFDAAIQLDPAKASAYVGRALSDKALGKITDALANLNRAAAVEPNYWLTYVERGDILLAERRFAEALAAYELSLTINSNFGRAQKGRLAAIALATAAGASATANPSVTLAQPVPSRPKPAPTAAPRTSQPPAPSTASPSIASPPQAAKSAPARPNIGT
jgi:tetratricopeptide (TPR) repeat protein